MDHLLDRPLGEEEGLADRRVALARRHLAQHVALACGQALERRLLAAGVLRDQRLHDLRVDHRAAGRDRADRRHELVRLLDALLEEVGTARAAALQEREGVARRRVLAQHHDADVGIGGPQPLGRLDPFVLLSGGIRMSVTTTSGCSASTAASRESRSPHTAATSRSGSPRAAAERPRARGDDRRRSRAGAAWREDTPVTSVLVVDDNDMNRKLALDVLGAAGFRTFGAATGRAGDRARAGARAGRDLDGSPAPRHGWRRRDGSSRRTSERLASPWSR